LRPKADLNAAVFRVSFYPLDGFFRSKPTQIDKPTSTHEVFTSAFPSLEKNQIFLSKVLFLSCYWGRLRGYLLGIVSITVSSRGFVLFQSLPLLPRLLTWFKRNGRSCVSVPVDCGFRPQSWFPNFNPLLYFSCTSSVRNTTGTLEYLHAGSVSLLC